jgi:hypothetical protein
MLDLTFLQRRAFVAAAAFMLAVACDDDPGEAEPEVATLRIIIGTDTVEVDEFGNVTGGPISIPTGATSLTAEWLRADGSPEPLVDDAEFDLQGVPANTGVVTFSSATVFTGTLTGVASGSTTIDFALFHTAEQHEDFGPHTVPVTVN